VKRIRTDTAKAKSKKQVKRQRSEDEGEKKQTSSGESTKASIGAKEKDENPRTESIVSSLGSKSDFKLVETTPKSDKCLIFSVEGTFAYYCPRFSALKISHSTKVHRQHFSMQ
jgi:hypothetical protein